MDNFETDTSEMLITLTSDIVAAHVSNNSVAVDEVPTLISKIHAALAELGHGGEPEEELPEPEDSSEAGASEDAGA